MSAYKRIVKNNRGKLGLGFFLNILSSFMLVFAGYSLSFLFSAYEVPEKQGVKLVQDAILVLGIWLVALFFMYISGVYQEKVLCRMRVQLRDQMSEKMVSFSSDEFFEKDSGHYVSWLTNDADQISEQSFESLFSLVSNLATAVFSLGAMLFLGIYIGLTALVLFVMISVLPQLISKGLGKVTKEKSEAQEVSVEAYKDSIMGYLVFKTSNCMGIMKQRIGESSEKVEKVNYKYSRCRYRVQVLISGIGLIGQVILLVVTLLMAIFKSTPIGAMLSVGNLSQSFFNSVGTVVQSYAMIKASKALWEKYEVEKKEEEKLENISEVEEIRMDHVNFCYGDKKVLNDVNFIFHANGKYAIIGESGSGKTTLTQILLGLKNGYEGNVLYDKSELRSIKHESLYRQISCLEQKVYLFQESIRFNITLGEASSDEQIWEVLRKCKMDEYVRMLPEGLDTKVEENGKNLSGGQRQRLALARAMFRKVRFIILDEGTSALDEANAIDIENNLMSDQDLCVIIITHHLRDEMKEKLDAVYEIPIF